MLNEVNIKLEDVGKKFYHRWLFKNIKLDLGPDAKRLALVGKNGSGKSTLLRIIAGQMMPSTGRIRYSHQGKNIPTDKIYQYISWSGPYIDLYPELNLREHIKLHFSLKSSILADPLEIPQIIELENQLEKPLQYYSSGMLQRVKVAISLFTDSSVLLLDEPTSNMDKANAERILNLIDENLNNRIFVLASNLEREYKDFENILSLD